MALQVFRNPDPMSRAMDSAGQGLASGLQALAQNKLQEVHRGKIADQFQKGFNVHPDLAQNMAMLYQSNPKEFTSQFHNYLQNIGGGTVPGQQLQEGEEPKYNTYQPGGAKVESKEDIKRDIAEQARIEPFLKGQYEDFNMSKKLYSKAKSMLDILEKNKKDWPGFIGGKLPDTFHRNPAVRKYLADANSLVTLLANSRKGQPTNAKIRFEQLAKPNLDQPYETQKALLEDVIKDTELVFDTQKNLEKIKKEHGNKFPGDIRQRIIEGGLESIGGGQKAMEDQGFPDAKQFPVGKKLTKDGVTIVNTPNGWEKV